jgi:serine phosphatase RsbU (regulator of sigma subunit)
MTTTLLSTSTPRAPDRPGAAGDAAPARAKVGAKVMPATGSEHSADFVAMCDRPDGTTAVVLGDVPGRGDGAHHFADGVQWLATTAASTPAGPAELLELLNTSIRRLHAPGSGIASATAVVADPDQRTIRWASAQHPAPWRLDQGEPLEPSDTGMMLGVAEVCGCQEKAVELPPGGGVLLVTDGVLEAAGPNGEPFGPVRLRHALCTLAGQSAACTASELLRAVCHYAGHHLTDDAGAAALRLPS